MSGCAAILAGGASRRFGAPKALHRIQGRTMIEHVQRRLQPLFESVFVAGWPPDLPIPNGMLWYPDRFSGKGAVAGIHTALSHTDSGWVFCCGCDMPLIQPKVIERMVGALGDEEILLPVIGGVRQSLHAIYRRNLLPAVEEICATADHYLPDLFGRADCRHLDENLFSDIPDYALSFTSFNERQLLAVHSDKLSAL